MAPKKNKTPSSKEGKTPEKGQMPNYSASPRSSPKLKSPKSLPDVVKRIRDCCASWHECIQIWEHFNDVGATVATKLTNLQLQKQYSDVDNVGSFTAMNELDKGSSSLLEEEIAKSTEEMSKIVDSLKKVHIKMQNLQKNFQAIDELQNLKKSSSLTLEESPEVITTTWTARDFCNAAEKLVSMYYQELTLKEKIWPEYTRSQNRNMQLVFLSLWIHQPYLEESHKTVLESMLLEVGLR